MYRILLKIFVFTLFLFPISIYAKEPIKILIVPGHDDKVWGAQYGNIKEADMNLALGTELFNILEKDKNFNVFITRDSGGYTKEFSKYFIDQKDNIISFRKDAKVKLKNEIEKGLFIKKKNSVYHNTASEDTAMILYGINKWASENKIDAVIHIHFNDYPRKNKWTIGKYKGFVIYVPEGQMENSKGLYKDNIINFKFFNGMPELPEVENLRIGLERSILGQKILQVEVKKPKLISGKGTLRTESKNKLKEFIKGITGEKFIKIKRRAKNLIFKISHGKILLVHLKMTGQFVYKPKNKGKQIIGGHPIEISETVLPNKHSHVIFILENGTLFYNDTRKFGYLLYYPNQKSFEKENHFQNLGKEPFDKKFTLKYFVEKLKIKKGKIKSILLNQEIVTGIGNIYADESLFESNIDPRRKACDLNKKEIKKLREKIISIMKRAIKMGGSSVSSYRLLDQSRGNYAREHKVYGKIGKNCVKCKKQLEKILINNRTTIFCSRCQK